MANDLVVTEEEKVVRVGLLYNVFDPTTLTYHDLVFQSGKPLSHYIEGLPDTCEWKIGLNSIPVAEEDYDEVIVAPDDLISVVCVPEGNDILRMVAILAIMVVAFAVLGPGAFGVAGLGLTGTTFAAAFAVTVAVGSFLVNMALPPAGMKLENNDDGQSYGYDGAKNTAREGIAIPIVYGNFWVGGNYVDVFTKNVGDDQYLQGRCVLSDGEIDGLIGEPYLNDLPISDYTGIEYGHTKGLLTEPVNNYFNRSIAQYAKSAKLDSNWVEYTTTGSVDAFQLNFVMPRGLIEYNDDGSRSPEDSVIEIQYRLFGTTTWNAPGIGSGGTGGGTIGSIGGGWGGATGGGTGSLVVSV